MAADLVANVPDAVEIEVCGVVELPVEVSDVRCERCGRAIAPPAARPSSGRDRPPWLVVVGVVVLVALIGTAVISVTVDSR